MVMMLMTPTAPPGRQPKTPMLVRLSPDRREEIVYPADAHCPGHEGASLQKSSCAFNTRRGLSKLQRGWKEWVSEVLILHAANTSLIPPSTEHPDMAQKK